MRTEDMTTAMTEGQKARDKGMARVAAHSDPVWVTRAEGAVVYLSVAKETFSADDVWLHLKEWGVEPPKEPRAMGPVIQRAVRDGVIVPVGYAQSTRRERHAAPVRIYRKAA